MMSIFGRSATPTAPPRKHNHFVPDGYIPPKSRQKMISPPRMTTPRMILKGGASPHGRINTPRRQNRNVPDGPAGPPSRPASRQNRVSPNRETPTPRINVKIGRSSPHGPSSTPRKQKQNVLPYAEYSRPPSRQTTPVDRKTTLRSILKGYNSPRRIQSEHSFPRVGSPSPQPSTSQKILNSPRGMIAKSAGSPKSPPGQQHCSVGGDDYTPPPSRQRKESPKRGTSPMQKSCSLGPSMKRSPPSSDGSYSSYGPISVVDKYDTRDSHLWKPNYPPGRVPPAKSARGRPRVRHPNILFDRVVNAQDDGGASCSQQCEDEVEEEPDECRKHEPCAGPLDWDRDPLLRSIGCEDRQAYRQCKLEEYLCEVCARQKQCEPPERFENYLIRCYAYANEELNSHKSKHLLGYVDDHLSSLDVWVLRLCRGAISRLARTGTAYPNRDSELFLRILREECVALDSERGSLLRRHLNETMRRLNACNEQERNYKKILLLSQRSPMGVMQHLRRRDWR